YPWSGYTQAGGLAHYLRVTIVLALHCKHRHDSTVVEGDLVQRQVDVIIAAPSMAAVHGQSSSHRGYFLTLNGSRRHALAPSSRTMPTKPMPFRGTVLNSLGRGHRSCW